MKHRHVIDLEDLTFAQLQQTIELAGKIKADPVKYSHVCDGKIMATLFMSHQLVHRCLSKLL